MPDRLADRPPKLKNRKRSAFFRVYCSIVDYSLV